jgi:putative ABC transport system permease protein
VHEGLGTPTVPVLRLPAVGAAESGTARLQLLGVDERLGRLAGAEIEAIEEGTVRLTAAAMEELQVGEGDRLVVRVERPGGLPGDSSLTREEGRVVALPLMVGAPWPATWPAQLALDADPQAPANAFVDLDWLQARIGWEGRVNLLMVHEREGVTPSAVRWALVRSWTLQDAGLEIVPTGAEHAVRTDRVLLSEALSGAASEVASGATPALSWFVDELVLGERSAPYSFVTALPSARSSGRADVELVNRLPRDLADDEIVLTDWLAEDLQAAPGSLITVRFPVLGRGRVVTQGEASLRVKAIVPVDAITADAGWMPPIEGLTGRDSCRSWDPGLPVDLSRIRDRDEAWWTEHGGAPKAFVTLETGRRLWGNPHGQTTTVRYPAAERPERLARGLLLRIRPEDTGISLRDVSTHLGATTAPANDFGVLFLGFQFVLIVSSLLLSTLLISLTLQRREGEFATLRAVGWSARRVGGLVLAESVIVVGGGVLLGLPMAALVSWGLVEGLRESWSVAIGGLPLSLVLTPRAFAIGAGAATSVSLLAVGLTAWRMARAVPRDLLLRRGTESVEGGRAGRSMRIAAGLALVGLVVVGLTPAERTPMAAGAFFGAGAAFLGAGLAVAWAALTSGGRSEGLSIAALAWRAGARRPRRSLTVLALLASGAFLVVGVGMGGGQAAPDAEDVHGGSGGYAAYAEAVLPLSRPVGDPEDPKAVASRRLLEGAEVVSLRRLDGDDASCLQLGSARTPHLLGVDPAAFLARDAFSFTSVVEGEEPGWALLEAERPEGRVPAIGDVSTVTWGLHLGVGDVLSYLDERGEVFEVEIVGVINNSVFQGSLILSEQQFVKRYPSEGGYRTLLFDAPDVEALTEALERDLVDQGLDVVSSEARLERFAAVEHTYVGIFHALGGLGLVLGAAGVGVVLARGVAERVEELALLRALGFGRGRIAGLLVAEHAVVLVAGLGIGATAAVVAVLPVLASPDADPPVMMAVAVLSGTLAVGLVAVLAAARWATAGIAVRSLLRG